MGYLADVVHEPGVTPSGEHFDAVQRGIKFNHLALLPLGGARAGSGARLRLDGNEEPESSPTSEEIMKVKIDGIEYDVGSASHIQALEKRHLAEQDRADKAEQERDAAQAALGKATAKADALEAELAVAKAVDVNALVQDELAFRAQVAPALAKDYA